MRTTVDLPPSTFRAVRERAASHGTSVSATIAELTARGLASVDAQMSVTTHPRSGLPVISVGRTVSTDDVTEALTRTSRR